MARAIITQITKTGTTYSVGRTARTVLTDLQGQIVKKKLNVMAFNKNTSQRGSFLSFASKSYIN